MVRLSKKLGFSMLEAAVTMLMVAVFTAAASNIFTQKHKKIAHHTSHGSFECYYDAAGQICERKTSENISQAPVCGLSSCTFRPSKLAEYYVINAIGGGGGGYQGGLGGTAGEFKSFFLTDIADEIRIIPGLGGTAGSSPTDGGDTLITDETGGVLFIAFGGQKGLYNVNSFTSTISANDIVACSLYFLPNSVGEARCISTGETPYCSISSSSVYASYCSDRDTISIPSTSYTYIDDSNQIYVQNSWMVTGGVRMYIYLNDDAFNFNGTREVHPSKLDEYLEAIDKEDIAVAGAGAGGRGGYNPTNGSPGAVYIVW